MLLLIATIKIRIDYADHAGEFFFFKYSTRFYRVKSVVGDNNLATCLVKELAVKLSIGCAFYINESALENFSPHSRIPGKCMLIRAASKGGERTPPVDLCLDFSDGIVRLSRSDLAPYLTSLASW
jgi:hypothetical protein